MSDQNPSAGMPATHAQAEFALRVERATGDMRTSARDRLVARAAHDLRSPLNGIQGWAHVLASRLGEEGGIVTKALDGIRNGVQQQVQMISDLTDLLHVMNAELGLEVSSADAQALLERAASDVLPIAQSRSVVLEVGHHAPLNVPVDAERFTQALRYVIAHCVRCAIEGDVLNLRVDATDTLVVFHIGDATLAQGDVGAVSTKKPAPLALAERIVDLHDGRFVAFALDAEGIRQGYRIEVPARQEAHAGSATSRQTASARAQMPDGSPAVMVLGDAGQRGSLVGRLALLGCVVHEGETDAVPGTPVVLTFVPTSETTVSAALGPCVAYSNAEDSSCPPGVLALVTPQTSPLSLAAMLLAAQVQDPAGA